jgi:small subunit ribosomal protein S16
MGAKKSPYYRIVVTDKRSPRDGRFIEAIGTYDPHTKPETVHLQMDRAAHWLANGAQASEGAVRILRRANLIDENGKALPYTPAESPVAGTAA